MYWFKYEPLSILNLPQNFVYHLRKFHENVLQNLAAEKNEQCLVYTSLLLKYVMMRLGMSLFVQCVQPKISKLFSFFFIAL